MSKETCGTCDHYGIDSLGDVSECQRYPPTVIGRCVSDRVMCSPVVAFDRPACGEHKPVVDEPETTDNEDRAGIGAMPSGWLYRESRD